jgi:hypothetical protein
MIRLGCFFLFLLLLVAAIAALLNQRAVGAGVLLIFALLSLRRVFRRRDPIAPPRCGICQNVFVGRTKIYVWEGDGEQLQLCSHCNRELARRKSSQAVKRFVG